jgi:hypothetical protein
MPSFVTMKIKLTVKGPLLCTATGVSAWGLDARFLRDHMGRPLIAKSHIKGKLREALRLLDHNPADLAVWLGKEDPNGKGIVQISDFTCLTQPRSLRSRRIRIDRERGTAETGAFMTVESLFASGEHIHWIGELSFPSPTGKAGEDLRDILLQGLRFITRLGADKTVGWGRLEQVECTDGIEESRVTLQNCPDAESLRFSITPIEPLLVGGVRIKDNYLPAETIFSGAVIKGALAACIRRHTGLSQNLPIKICSELDSAGLSVLAEYFDDLRFASAFPSRAADKRPVVPPLSLVKSGNDLLDVLPFDEVGLINGKAPAFKIDWKGPSDVDAAYGWASPKKLTRTQTAIEESSLNAKEEKLYTFEHVCPIDDDNKAIIWLGAVTLPDIEPQKRAGLASQLLFVLNNWFSHLGKRDGKMSCTAETGSWEPAITYAPSGLNSGQIAVVLQSDALMLDPEKLNGNDRQSVLDGYAEYWGAVSGDSLKLVRCFASQRIAGGYLGMRFKSPGKYCPFLLTAAGSVFLLEFQEERVVQDFLESWSKRGLPPPGWALDKYGKDADGSERLDWAQCPFTRENGYGEVVLHSAATAQAKGGC